MSQSSLPARRLPRKTSFSQELRDLSERYRYRPVRLEVILKAAQGRGFHLLLVLIALPFLTPIPLPGFSMPFGLVVAVIGLRLALGKKPWLPQRLLQRELSPRFIARILGSTSWIVKRLEFILRPRLAVLHDHRVFRRLAGAMIALCGLYLVPPLPVPFSNALAAFTVLLLAAGALERDGLFFIAGCVSFLITTSFFVMLAVGGVQAVDKLRQLVGG
jgi:hypothetical protein